MHIRPFVDTDYEAITRLHNHTYTDFEKFVDQMRHNDATFPSTARWERWTAVDDRDHVVAYAQYQHVLGLLDPHKFTFDIGVDPACLGHGLGSRLYETVLAALLPYEPATLASWARDDQPCLLGFLSRRGFEPNTRMYTSSVDLTGFDASRWDDHVEGIEVRSLAELGLDDPDVRREVYEMWREVREDVPIPEGETRNPPMSMEAFWDITLGPSLYPAGFFVGFDGPRCVGTSQLWLSPVNGVLRTGLTGVRRAYRRRGIATALKVHALRFAQQQGYQRVVTDNAADNAGMLAINAELGFERNPGWTRYLKTF